MNKLFAIVGAALLMGTAAFAQTATQVPTLNPTSDLIPVIPLGQPSARTVYASPAEINATSYAVKRTPTTTSAGDGYTSTFGNYQTKLILSPALTMSYAYVTFAPAPSDGATECVFSKSAITALWLTANTGQTVNDAATSLAANGSVCYTYSSSNLTWDRSM